MTVTRHFTRVSLPATFYPPHPPPKFNPLKFYPDSYPHQLTPEFFSTFNSCVEGVNYRFRCKTIPFNHSNLCTTTFYLAAATFYPRHVRVMIGIRVSVNVAGKTLHRKQLQGNVS